MQTAAAHTRDQNLAAGEELGRRIALGLAGANAGALMVFASSGHDFLWLLSALDAACRPRASWSAARAQE